MEEHLADDVPAQQLSLERSLARMRAALASTAALGAEPSVSAGPPLIARWGAALAALSAGAFFLFAETSLVPFLPVAFASGISGAMLLMRGFRQKQLSDPTSPAHIGMGANVASSAMVEPGAVVEMGATIRSGASIRSGALVGMGATVGANATIEGGAVVSWGATVGANATVEAGAVVSWGATVRAGAVLGTKATLGWGATIGKGVRVPPGTRLRAGSTVSAGWLKEHLPGFLPTPPPARGPAEARTAIVCDRLVSELRSAPQSVRSFLGTSEATIVSLRHTCEDLLRREQALRVELDPGATGRLDEEKRALEQRLLSETDERIRNSLVGAMAAIDEQRRQRELLRVSAERLQAERMRLIYTLEGLVSQFVRLRTAGAEAGRAPGVDLEEGVKQLGAELDAIADALEKESEEANSRGSRVRE
jgi:carbonic anhydrase/acetyltransferase-like protein (isoleucine patch superfamily)